MSGRSPLSWDERLALDVDNRSLPLDLGVLLLTVKKVVALEGINKEGQATMERTRKTRHGAPTCRSAIVDPAPTRAARASGTTGKCQM